MEFYECFILCGLWIQTLCMSPQDDYDDYEE